VALSRSLRIVAHVDEEGRGVGHGEAEHDDSDAVIIQGVGQREERGHASACLRSGVCERED